MSVVSSAHTLHLPQPQYPNLFNQIKDYRGVTFQNILDGTSIPMRSLMRYASGERKIPYARREELARFLECDPDHLAPDMPWYLVVQSLEKKNYHHEGKEDMKRRTFLQGALALSTPLLLGGSVASLPDLGGSEQDLLHASAQSIAACQDLYYNEGLPHQVEVLLPLHRVQCLHLVGQTRGNEQKRAASIASQAHQLAAELLIEKQQFEQAQTALRHAFHLGTTADDVNLKIASLIQVANIGFHQRHSTMALAAYQQAESLFTEQTTPLIRGRVYAGMAEVLAMESRAQEAIHAMGMAYEVYPEKPEQDPSFSYLQASRYALHVFGGVQSYLFLKKPKAAAIALKRMEDEREDTTAIDPLTEMDFLYYRAEIQRQQGNLEGSREILTRGVALARSLNSSLYYDKLQVTYKKLARRYPKEPVIISLHEVFQPWK